MTTAILAIDQGTTNSKAVLVSTAVIVPSWRDARFGMAANAVALVGVAFGMLAFGPQCVVPSGRCQAVFDLTVSHVPPDKPVLPRPSA